MALQDKPKYSASYSCVCAKTCVENVAKSNDFMRDPVLNLRLQSSQHHVSAIRSSA